ncbi:hypothetical protein ABFS83_10G019400 [Erythranthe nasuta]
MAAFRFERVAMLLWFDIIAIYAIWMLMPYLTSVWDVSISRAAAIVNIFWSFVLLSPFFIAILIDTVMCYYWSVIVSTVSLSVGLGFLAMSTPPVLAHISGNCSEYSAECIGQGQRVLLYMSLPLIAFGMAGHLDSLYEFMREQFRKGEAIIDDRISMEFDGLVLRFSGLSSSVFTLIAVLGLPYIKPWSLRFGIPAICSLVATVLFFSAASTFKFIGRPIGGVSPFMTFFKVLFAAFSKLFYTIPTDAWELYEIQDNSQLHLVPHSRSLRWLDKAAIVIPKPIPEQMWRLCRVTQVEETKAITRMIPVWMTFVLCGVVSSMPYTFFMEQLDHMNPKIVGVKVPILVLIWFQSKVIQHCTLVCIRIQPNLFVSRVRMSGFVGIVVSMIVAILCCVTCAKVESQRLDHVRKQVGSLSMFMLLPQMILLGVFRFIFDVSVLCLFSVKDSDAVMDRYLPILISCVLGVGCLANSVLVFVVGKISERGGKMNWFQHDLDQSRLDKYYYTLAWLMAVNLVAFIVVAALHRFNEWKLEDEQAAAQSGQPYVSSNQECCFCCCC